MVATRRGARVKSTNDEATGTPASTVRSTRHRTEVEQTSDSQQDESEEQNAAPAESASSTKTRGSKSHPTDKQPESTHEADVSESESCCSVASDVQPTSRSRRRLTVRAKPTAVDEQEASKAGSSSSSLAKTPRRSTRGQKKPVPVLESTTSQEDEHSEAESCSSSVASLSTRVTRSQRKPAAASEDAAHSEDVSCSSAVSGTRGSTVRRSTRSKVKVTVPIPIHLEERETTEASAAFEHRRTHRGKAKSTEQDKAYASGGYQSGPSLTPRRATRSRVADSDSESISTAYTSLDSPCSTLDRATPCSSRTGSASSNHAVRICRSRKVRVTLDVINMPTVGSKSVKNSSEENKPEKQQAETTEDISYLSVSTANSDEEDIEEIEEDAKNKTVIAADQECSVAEDNIESKQDLSSETEKAVEECAGIAVEAMETHEASSVQEVQAMEDESSSQKSVTGTQEDQSNITEEPNIVVEQSSDPAKYEENFKVLGETEEKVEAAKNMSDMAADVEQGPSSSSNASKTSIEKTKPVKGCISLLDSSEDDESDDDGLSVDGGNDEAGDLDSEAEMCSTDNMPGPSSAPDSLMSNGLFVIDARPGFQPSEKYYIDTTQNEDDIIKDCKAVDHDEDFVDEEGGDDEGEDEDTKVLFTTRKPALYEFNF